MWRSISAQWLFILGQSGKRRKKPISKKPIYKICMGSFQSILGFQRKSNEMNASVT